MNRGAAGIAAAVLLLVASSAAAAREGVQLQRGAQNHLLVTAQVNGRTATFLVDTGAQGSFFRADRAAEFGIQPVGRQTRLAGRTFSVGAVNDLRVGNHSLGNMEVALYSAAQIGGHLPGRGGKVADGAIGLDVLRRHRAVIDCRAGRMWFNTAGRPVAVSAGATRIGISDSRRSYLTVPVTIRGRRGRLALDTGAFVTTLDRGHARALGLETQTSRATARRFDGRVRQVELTRVDDLRIGTFRVPPQQFAVIHLFDRRAVRATDGFGRIQHTFRPDTPRVGPIFGLLGSELLYQHHGVIDLGAMALHLR
jgi:predicted aspartyl protease